MLLFGEFIVSLISEDPLVVETARIYLIIIPLGIGFLGITMTATHSFNALGKPMPPLIISILQMLVVYVPLALIFDFFWGYTGIFIAFTVTNILIGILAWLWINHRIRLGSVSPAVN